MTSRRQLQYIATVGIGVLMLVTTAWLRFDVGQSIEAPLLPPKSVQVVATGDAASTLDQLLVKGRAPKTDYARAQFGDGWLYSDGCDTRNRILSRDLVAITKDERCRVMTGVLHDPYTGVDVVFTRGAVSSADVQIDHVIALSNAWQTGAQQLSQTERIELANDPLELLAVDGLANRQKSDGDAASWLPSNKVFRCQYIARQIAVKQKYSLWVTSAEKDAMIRVLATCPGQPLPR